MFKEETGRYNLTGFGSAKQIEDKLPTSFHLPRPSSCPLAPSAPCGVTVSLLRGAPYALTIFGFLTTEFS